jgi:hypothetical protein
VTPDPDAQIVEPAPRSGKAERSISTLLSDLAGESILLVRQELALLKAELNEKFSRAGQGVSVLAAGGLIAYSGLLVLLAAAVLGLATVWPAWLAALVIGIATVVVGGLLLLTGKNRFSSQSWSPERTMRTLREDEAWLRERLR